MEVDIVEFASSQGRNNELPLYFDLVLKLGEVRMKAWLVG